MLKNILVAFDGSEPSLRAFGLALGLAQPSHAKVILFSAVRVRRRREPRLLPVTQQIEAQFGQLRSIADTFRVSLQTSIMVGYASSMARIGQLVSRRAATAKADLVLVGYPMRRRFSELFWESPERSILRTAPCAVLFVR